MYTPSLSSLYRTFVTATEIVSPRGFLRYGVTVFSDADKSCAEQLLKSIPSRMKYKFVLSYNVFTSSLFQVHTYTRCAINSESHPISLGVHGRTRHDKTKHHSLLVASSCSSNTSLPKNTGVVLSHMTHI